MVDRQFPRPSDLRPLLRFRAPRLDRRAARLADAQTIEDLRRIAKRRTPRAAFDYTDGSAEAEISIARARQAFQDVEFHPQVLRDVAQVATTATVFGGPSRMPFGIAPTGFTRLMQTEGETAGARAPRTPPGSRSRSPRSAPPPSSTCRRRTRRPELVPAVRDAAAGDLLRPSSSAPRRGRVRDPVLHRRHARRRCPAAGQAQRVLHPPAADRPDRPRRAAPALVVDRLPHHPEAAVSPPSTATGGTVGDLLDMRWTRPSGSRTCRSSGTCGLASSRSRASSRPRGREAVRRPRRRRDRALQPRRAAARPRPDPLPPAARGRPRGGIVVRDVLVDTGITDGADVVAPSPSARGSRWSAAPTSTG